MILNPVIIARKRPEQVAGSQLDIVAVRWAIDPGGGLPGAGFTVKRSVGGILTALVTGWGLPGAVLDPSGTSWIIDPAQLLHDARARQTNYTGTPVGPYPPDPDKLAALMPVLLFALEKPQLAELKVQLPHLIEDALGPAYAQDPALAAKYWPRTAPPPLAALLAMAHSVDPIETAIYDDVIALYRRLSVVDLIARAADFGFAKFLGLGIDDVLPGGTNASSVKYILDVVVALPPPRPQATAWVNERLPSAPIALAATLADGAQGYEAFAPFYDGTKAWKAPRTAGWTHELESLACAAERGPRRISPIVGLTWLPPGPEDDSAGGLADLEPVLWRVERGDYGSHTAGDPIPPPLDPGMIFAVCAKGDRTHLPAENASFLDDTGPRWSEGPMEGWYAYQVSAIDCFGIVGKPCSPIQIRVTDENGPPPPRPILDRPVPPDNLRLEIPQGALQVTAPLELAWDWDQELNGPDTEEFRLRYRVSSLEFSRVNVATVMPADGALDAVRCVVRLTDESGDPIEPRHLADLVGKTLVTVTTEHRIVDLYPAQASAVQVHRSVGRPPGPGVASVREMGEFSPPVLLREKRVPARAAGVEVTSIDPLRVRLRDSITGKIIKPRYSKIYLHFFNATFATSLDVPGEHSLLEVDLSKPVLESLAAWRRLAPPDANAVLNGSPAVVLPFQPVQLDVAVADTLDSGLLDIEVRAADSTRYKGTRSLRGNEGGLASLQLTLARSGPPGRPAGKPPKLWSRSAGEYVDATVAQIKWQTVPRAARYEIERILENTLGLSPEVSDDDLIAAVGDPPDHVGFERCATPSIGNVYDDMLSGRAPTRVLYRVRAVTAAEIRGEWSLAALVRVPDIRIPPPPNLIIARAPEPIIERALDLQWTQAGGLNAIGFLIEVRRQHKSGPFVDNWHVVAEFLPGMLTPSPENRFNAQINNILPGPRFDVRVSAVRYALDPIDPLARMTRRIVGYPSLPRAAVALGALRPPTRLKAASNSAFHVSLSWINNDRYDEMEVRRRPPGISGFRRQQVPETGESFSETVDRPGVWTYQLLAIGFGCHARSVEIDIEVQDSP